MFSSIDTQRIPLLGKRKQKPRVESPSPKISHVQFSYSKRSVFDDFAPSPLLKVSKRDRLFVFGENFNRLIDEQDPFALHLEMDDELRRKNLRTFCNAMFGILLMIIENFVNWDGQKVVKNDATEALKILTTISTSFLMLQILEHYRVVSYKVTSGYFSTSFRNIPFIMKHRAIAFALELLVCVWHIPPYIDSVVEGYPDRYGIFMFFRIYLVFRVLRDYSPVYRNRAHILQRGYSMKAGAGLDSWVIHVRMHFFRSPGLFMTLVLVAAYLSLTFCIYVQEREVQEAFTFSLTMWYTAVTMTTIGYGDYTATTTLGRICAMFAGTLGLIISSLCVAVTARYLTLSRREKFAVDWVNKADLDQQVESAAATVIQSWWRLLKLKSLGKLTPAKEYKYGSEVIRCVVLLRRYRKELVTLSQYINNPVLLNYLQLEGRYDPILDRTLEIEDRVRTIGKYVKDIYDCFYITGASTSVLSESQSLRQSMDLRASQSDSHRGTYAPPTGIRLVQSDMQQTRAPSLSSTFVNGENAALSAKIESMETRQMEMLSLLKEQNNLLKEISSKMR